MRGPADAGAGIRTHNLWDKRPRICADELTAHHENTRIRGGAWRDSAKERQFPVGASLAQLARDTALLARLYVCIATRCEEASRVHFRQVLDYRLTKRYAADGQMEAAIVFPGRTAHKRRLRARVGGTLGGGSRGDTRAFLNQNAEKIFRAEADRGMLRSVIPRYDLGRLAPFRRHRPRGLYRSPYAPAPFEEMLRRYLDSYWPSAYFDLTQVAAPSPGRVQCPERRS